MRLTSILLIVLLLPVFFSCSKKSNNTAVPVYENFISTSIAVNGVSSAANNFSNTSLLPVIRLAFSTPVSRLSASTVISFTSASGTTIPLTLSYQNKDSVVVLQPAQAISSLSAYAVVVPVSLTSATGGKLTNAVSIRLSTAIDTADKFPRIADTALLTLLQRQTLSYFTALAHPVSGMALERNSDANTCTTGGTGFGVMAMLAGINRNFMSRADGLTRITKIVNFLGSKTIRYHGAFSHWVNGSTGATLPFSTADNGADLVETSYLLQGLLSARQYFNTNDPAEQNLRDSINVLWNGVDWNWFRQNAQNQLYWHWSPTAGFAINLAIKGWNEALLVYVLAASSNTSAIPKVVYDHGWASDGSIKNNNTYYGVQLPLGPAQGGPLFFAHYSFLGIDPRGLSDSYANYSTQNINHSLINYKYCMANPQHYYGYSNNCWGLTASDDPSGYSAHAPDNDNGTISPTAAISSLPYTPGPSMDALKFFYYTLGDKIWGQYGFTDAFNLNNLWFANSFLAIDQAPQVVMIENYRSGMLWSLFTSCPEIKTGMKSLGFSAPYL